MNGNEAILQSRKEPRRGLADAARILVVEDDRDTRHAVEVRLSAAGYEVFQIGDGTNAVALAQKIKPDLIVLDLGLPGMDGIQVLHMLLAVMPGTRVIVVSAWDESRYEEEALEAGALLYLQKPIVGDQLLLAVSGVLDLT